MKVRNWRPRWDLLEGLHAQVEKSIAMGARLVTGGKKLDRTGNSYAATIFSNVRKGMPVYEEETFGPVAANIIVKHEMEAITVANDTQFGPAPVFGQRITLGANASPKSAMIPSPVNSFTVPS